MISTIKLTSTSRLPQRATTPQASISQHAEAEVHFGASKASKIMVPVASALAMLGVAGCSSPSPFAPTKSTSSIVSVLQTTPDGGVVVNGTGIVKKDPDQFSFNTSIKTENKDYDAVVKDLSTRGEALSESLKGLNLSLDCQSGVSVQPKYQYNDGKTTLEGYSGTYNLRLKGKVTTENQFKQDASLITKALAQHNALFDGPYFDLSDKKQANEEALQKAIKETVAKAQIVAKIMGFDVNEKTPFSVSIGNDNDGSSYRPAYGLRVASAAPTGNSGIAEEAFKLKQIEISSPQVSIRFHIDNNTNPEK